MKDYKNTHFSTMTIHAGQYKDPSTGAASTPIFQTSTFLFDTVDEPAAIYKKEKEGFTYTRGSNPTTQQLEHKIATVEGAEACVATASGMGAISSVLLSLLSNGDHLLASETLYGGTAILLHNMMRFGIEITYADMSYKEQIIKNIKPNTKMIYLESPANPTIKLADIKFCAETAHSHNAILVIDGTFAPPPIQYSLALGADISIHSTTKYICGHGDAIGGVISGRKKYLDIIKTEGMKCICGATPSPFNSWLILRGMKTFSMRIIKHCENAMKIARYLECCPQIKKVHYPGLESHPQHELANIQMNGYFGGMIAFELKDEIQGYSGFEVCKRVLNNLEICSIGVSLGDVDTLIEHPASMTHITYSKYELAKAGISDTLIRLSVGLEDAEDIINDFEQAFEKIK